jgi:hypothetical protein
MNGAVILGGRYALEQLLYHWNVQKSAFIHLSQSQNNWEPYFVNIIVCMYVGSG